MLEGLSDTMIREQWRRAPIVRVAIDIGGRTYIEPMPSTWTETGLVVGMNAAQASRLASACSRVCVQYDDAADPNDWTSVMAWSRPQPLTGPAEVRARQKLRDAAGWSSTIRDALDSAASDRHYRVVLLPLVDQVGRRQRSMAHDSSPATTVSISSRSSAGLVQAVTVDAVLVPIDGSAVADRALPVARWVSEVTGAAVHLIGVARSSSGVGPLHGVLADRRGMLHGRDVIISADVGDAIAVVSAKASRSGVLLCVASHGPGRIEGALVGSIAMDMAVASARECVVVGPCASTDRHVGPVLVPMEPGGIGSRMLPTAAAWARTLDVALELLTIEEADGHLALGTELGVGAEGVDRHVIDRDRMASHASTWRNAGIDVDVVIVADTKPANGIVTEARRIDAPLIAVTTSLAVPGRIRQLASTTAALVRDAGVPVLIKAV